MGILIRIDLAKNNKELNVKVLDDDGLPDLVDRKLNTLANLNVAINRNDGENETDLILESVRTKGLKPSSRDTENESDIIVEPIRGKCMESNSGRTENVRNIGSTGGEIQLKSVSSAVMERDGEEENENYLEEYFIVDKIVGNRFNPSTQQYEFLLKLKDCEPISNAWKPMLNSKVNSLPEGEGRLYVQKTKSLMPLKRKVKHGYSSTNCRENQTTESSTEKNLQPEPLINVETDGITERTESGEPSSNFGIVNESLRENVPSDAPPSDHDFCLDTDSTLNISIKCEPIIEDEEDNECTYEPMDSMLTHYNMPIADTSIREDVKPFINYLPSNITNPLSCNLCGRTFSGIQYLRKHEKIHLKGTIFTCSVCNYAFSNLYLLTAHERDSHGIYHAPKRRGCPPGPRKRPIEPEMRGPSLVNTVPSQIRVSSFAKTFESQLSSVEKPFKCPLCTRTFRNQQALTLHEGVHNDGHLFPCNTCDRVFTYLHALKNHERIHSNIKPVPCTYCGKLFTMESRRKLHERKHRIDFKNQRSTNMVPVERTHDEVERPYLCRYCPKAFRLKHTLVVHTRVHTGEKPFACSLCDYRSSQKISLDCHMRKHEKSWIQNLTY